MNFTLPPMGMFIAYTLIATLLLGMSVKIFDRLFRADIQKEVFENRNVAAGIVLGSLLIGLSIIAASAMH